MYSINYVVLKLFFLKNLFNDPAEFITALTVAILLVVNGDQ
jgi:hypothetical protein